MEFHKIKQYIENIEKKGIVLGLDSMQELLKRLGRPDRDLKIVHIAGTNGKGSILAMIQACLIQAGYRCGRYISPTIFAYEERFQINNVWIEKKEFQEVMKQVIFHCKEMVHDGYSHPTAFEMETACAFLWFMLQKVDIVLLETGLGGRDDATNCIERPLCTVFSSISRDHMKLLGDTVEEIASIKAGIIKKHCPVVVYPNENKIQQILKIQAKEKECQWIEVEKDEIIPIQSDTIRQQFSYKNVIYHLSLLGEHQQYNCATALEVLFFLQKKYTFLTKEHIKQGMTHVVWKGRLEIVRRAPLWIRDGAHNEDAALRLYEAIKQIVKGKNMQKNFPKVFLIMGVFQDKEYEKIIKIMSPLAHMFLTIEANHEQRKLSSSLLTKVARHYCTPVVDCKCLENAVKFVKEIASNEDIIVVFGSLSFIGQLEQIENFIEKNKFDKKNR